MSEKLPAYGMAPIRCAKRGCDWTGTERELAQKLGRRHGLNVFMNVCPKCSRTNYFFMTEEEIARAKEPHQP